MCTNDILIDVIFVFFLFLYILTKKKLFKSNIYTIFSKIIQKKYYLLILMIFKYIIKIIIMNNGIKILYSDCRSLKIFLK